MFPSGTSQCLHTITGRKEPIITARMATVFSHAVWLKTSHSKTSQWITYAGFCFSINRHERAVESGGSVAVFLEGRSLQPHTAAQLQWSSMSPAHGVLKQLMPPDETGGLYVLVLLSFFPLYCWFRKGGECLKCFFIYLERTVELSQESGDNRNGPDLHECPERVLQLWY